MRRTCDITVGGIVCGEPAVDCAEVARWPDGNSMEIKWFCARHWDSWLLVNRVIKENKQNIRLTD